MHADDRTSRLSFLLLNHTWFAEELRALGHEVVCAGWAHGGFDVVFPRLITVEELAAFLPRDFAPTHVVYYDDSHSVSVVGLDRLAVPLLFYSVDAHHHHLWQRYLVDLSDRTLVAQHDYLAAFARFQTRPVPLDWFPLWAPQRLEPAAERDIPVSFRGTLDPTLHPERQKFFDKIRLEVPVDAGPGSYADVYPRSHIVLNQTIGCDVNFRVFEALMSGALLITPGVGNGFYLLFEEGKHLVSYVRGDAADALEKIQYYLAHPEEAQAIAAEGRALVLASHTAEHRARQLADLARNTVREPSPHRAVAAAALLLSAVQTYRNIPKNGEGRNPWHDRLIAEATQLLRGLSSDTVLSDELRAMLFLATCFLEVNRGVSESIAMLQQLCATFPGDLLLKLCLSEELLRCDRGAEAEAIAEEVAVDGRELLACLPSLLGEARSQVLRSLTPAE